MSETLSIGSKTLFEHQMVAVEWMRLREQDDSFCGGFLCDEMGLGKTLTTLAHIHTASSTSPNNLLLGPLAVLNQWQEAAADAGLRVFRLVKGAWVCVEGGDSSTAACLYMSNYDRLLASPKAFLRDVAWDRFILDEAHTMRNGGSKRYAILRKIRAPRTWFLTGTPLVNNTKDLSALVHLINRSHKPNKPMTESEGAAVMAKYGLARTMAMVRDKIRGAPSQFDVETHRLPFATNAERLFYRGVQGALKKQLQMLYEGRLKGNTEMMFLVLLLRLRQISVHLQVYVDSLKQRAAAAKKPCPVKDYTGSSTKIEKLVGLLTEAAAADERRDWVVFCQFREEINLVEERLKKESGLVSRIFRYDGSMSMEGRQEQINASKQVLPEDAGKQKVFLVQIKAGGAGLNLQHFHNVVFMSPWWNAAQMDQAIGRVQRIGQAQKVGVHYLILEEEEEQSRNIDRYMYKKVAQKKEICEVFLQSSSHFLTRQDMAAQDGDAEAEDVAEDNVAFYEQFEQIDMDYDMFEDDEEVGTVVSDSDSVSGSDSEDPQ